MSKLERLRARQSKGTLKQAATGESYARLSKLRRYTNKVSGDQKDIDRICELPIVPEISAEEAEHVSKRWLLASAYSSGHRLLTTQAEGIQCFEEFGAGFFKLGVGWGKTGLSLLCAEHSYREGKQRIILFLPSSVYPQLIQRDLRFWRKMISLSVPIHRLGGQTVSMRRRIVDAQRKGLYIMPTSLLSRPDALHMLRAIDPDVIVADEAHHFKNRRAGRTKKLFGWLEEREAEDRPKPALVAMSGTMTSKSIQDYHHLISWALADGSPLPINASLAKQWGTVIDSGSVLDGERQTGPLRKLVGWAAENFPAENFRATVSDFRRAYKLRLTTAPGVVSTGDQEIDTTLTLATAECGQPGSELRRLMERIKEDHETPNGDVIEHAVHEYKWMSELTAGFYNELVWPAAEKVASRTWIVDGKEITFTEPSAKEALTLAREHHSCQQVYASELRSFMQDAPLGLDTPMEVAWEIVHHPERIPDMLVTLYKNMKLVKVESEQRFGTLLSREAHVHRVDDYKVQAAVDWARARTGGALIWFWHNGIGRWLRDALDEAGLDMLYCPAGKEGNEAIGDEDNAGKIVVASIAAHGIGKNLQHFQEQLFVQWPRVARDAEQVLGRTHRTGQLADELRVDRLVVTDFDILNFAACLNDSVYAHQSTGDRQKMVYANYDPLPMVFSPEFLREQGADPKILTAEQREMMDEIFGENWQDSL